MASPQREEGHIDIANEIVDQLCRYRIPGQEWQIIWATLRKTWGWAIKNDDGTYARGKGGEILKKKWDRISLSQFSKMTGMSRKICHKRLKSLENKEVIERSVPQKGDRRTLSYRFQKNYERWKLSPKRGMSPKRETKLSPLLGNTKGKEKETLSRKTLKPEFFDLVSQLSESMLRNDSKAKVPGAESQKIKWGNEFCLLVEKDKRPIEEIKGVLEWSQADSFWRTNILSAGSFRKQYPKLRLKMMEEQNKQGGQQSFTDEEYAAYMKQQRELLKK